MDDGKFTKELCPVAVVLSTDRVEEVVLLKLFKDPGNVTKLLLPFVKNALVLLDSVTICGLGYVDPSKFSRAIVVSKYVPNIRKAYDVARSLYGNDEFVRIAEQYLAKVKCYKRGKGKLCVAPYNLSYEEALALVKERSKLYPVPEELWLAHSFASAVGRYLTRAPSPP